MVRLYEPDPQPLRMGKLCPEDHQTGWGWPDPSMTLPWVGYADYPKQYRHVVNQLRLLPFSDERAARRQALCLGGL